MTREETIIVNENDEIIGYKDRTNLTKEDIYRVSALWVENSKGDVLLQQRGLNKRINPGKWGPAAAGTHEKGDTYESCMLNEAQEEIGLTDFEFKFAFKDIHHRPHSNYFVKLYYAIIDRPIEYFKIQKEEVESIKWWPREELKHALKDNPDIFLKSVSEDVEYFDKSKE